MSLQDAKLLLTPNAYKASKLYAVKPIDGTGDATVTRNTTKTRVNSSGLIESNAVNVLAPDYLNGVCPALNVEGQRTNFLEHSQQFDNAVWTKSLVAASITTDTISPDGSTNAYKIVETGTDTVNYSFFQSTPSTIGNTYTISVFAKKADRQEIYIQATGAINLSYAFFDINTGTVGTMDGVDSANIKDYGNGWYRCSITVTTTIQATLRARFYLVAVGENLTHQGGGTNNFGIFFWGAQTEEGTQPTSYIATTTAAVTRSADNVTIPIPAGVTEIVEKYEDGTTNTITTIPASPYTVPVGRYEYILMR